MNPCISVVGLRSTATKDDIEIKMVLMGAQEMMTIMGSVEFHFELPEGIFDVPAEIQELLTGEQPKAGD